MAETVVSGDLLRGWPLPRPGDKESRGRVVLLGGGDHTPGAVLLAAEAALRAGAGKVQLVTSEAVAAACAVALPEALVVGTDTHEGHLIADGARAAAELGRDADCVLVGPGLEDVDAARELVEALVRDLPGGTLLVVDALAMAYVTAQPGGLHGRQAVLTPNSEELAIALGADPRRAADQEVGEADVRQLSRRTHAVVSSGGSTSWVARPDGRCWQLDGGGPGLATAGSGDVLAGVVAGVAARCGRPDQAAVWGTALHKRAGELVAAQVGTMGYLAREVLAAVPSALAEVSD